MSRQLFNVGAADRPDVLESAIEARRMRLALTAAKNALDATRWQLAALVGDAGVASRPLTGSIDDAIPELERTATVRTLIELLENGSPYANEGDSPLYAGGKIGWVKSATTISTPHNGTTLREVIISSMPKMPELIGLIIQATGLGGSNNPVYNFKLEQYGLEHTSSKDKDSENIKDFINRTKAAPFWKLEERPGGTNWVEAKDSDDTAAARWQTRSDAAAE